MSHGTWWPGAAIAITGALIVIWAVRPREIAERVRSEVARTHAGRGL